MSGKANCSPPAAGRSMPPALWHFCPLTSDSSSPLPQVQMLVSLLLTTMASAGHVGASDFAHSTCRHFALLFASGWGREPLAALPPSSKYTSYPVLEGMPASVAALKHLHPQAILEAFQEVRRLWRAWHLSRAVARPPRHATS